MKRLPAFLASLLLPLAALHADPTMAPSPLAYTELSDPAQEAKARALMETIRCVVCQGQSIADSDADLAGGMRAVVRARIAAGEKPEDIRAWLISRYGRWISYKPDVEPLTWPLWAAPLVLLMVGGTLAMSVFKRRRS